MLLTSVAVNNSNWGGRKSVAGAGSNQCGPITFFANVDPKAAVDAFTKVGFMLFRVTRDRTGYIPKELCTHKADQSRALWSASCQHVVRTILIDALNALNVFISTCPFLFFNLFLIIKLFVCLEVISTCKQSSRIAADVLQNILTQIICVQVSSVVSMKSLPATQNRKGPEPFLLRFFLICLVLK